MDVDQELFKLYKDKALLWSSKSYIFISTLLIAFMGIVVPSILPFFSADTKINMDLINSIKYLLLAIVIVMIFMWYYNEAKYREYRKNYMTIIISYLIDAELSKGSEINVDKVAKEIVSKTMFDYTSAMQIIKENYNIK